MRPGVGVWRCARCHARLFPQRLLCPRCHGAEFEEDRHYQGVVEEVAMVRHMLGQRDWQPRRIASVRIGDELRITIGLIEDCEPGTVIELFEQGTAPFGKAKTP